MTRSLVHPALIALAWTVPAPAAAQLSARTTLVLVPRANIELDSKAPQHGQVTIGGTAVWLPGRPLVAEAAFQQTMLAVGATTFEIGGGIRLNDMVGGERVSIVTDGYKRRGTTNPATGTRTDTVYTYYEGRDTDVRTFRTVRAGLTSLTYQPDGLPRTPAMTALYAGVSTNKLINTDNGSTALRVIQRTGLDVLVGSPPAGAYAGSSLGFRAYLSRDVGGIIGYSLELGSRPGFGGYGLATMDLYFMFTDILR